MVCHFCSSTLLFFFSPVSPYVDSDIGSCPPRTFKRSSSRGQRNEVMWNEIAAWEIAAAAIAVAVTCMTCCASLLPCRRWVSKTSFPPLFDATASVVVVTGASAGIGLEFALLFSSLNCHVMLLGRTLDTLERAAKLCRAGGAASATVCACDVTDPVQVARFTHQLRCLCSDRNASLKYLILNAGAGAIVPFAGASGFINVAREMMDINYFSNVRLLEALLPVMLVDSPREVDDGRGSSDRRASLRVPSTTPARVLVVSSLAGVLPSTLRAAYTASKHAIQGFTNAIRGEYDRRRVTFTVACPGYVDTAFHEKAAHAAKGTSSESVGSTHRKGSMSAKECAAQCAAAMLSGKPEVIFTLSGRLAYCLRPFLPQWIDGLAAKKSFASVGVTPSWQKKCTKL